MQETDPAIRVAEEAAIRRLLSLDPETPIQFNDIGWTSRVYLIARGEIVFKFPRTPEAREDCRFEVRALDVARRIDSEVRVPEVRWADPDLAYFGYLGIAGRPFDRAAATFDPAEMARIGTAIGRFLRDFHPRRIAGAPVMPPEAEFAEHREKLAMGMAHIAAHFAAREAADIRHLVTIHYPARMAALGHTPGLCHGDLGYWNMIRPDRGGLGVIDFGDVGYFDTSIDFAGMTDPDMREAALSAYGHKIPAEKIALRQRIIPILDLPFHIGKGDPAGIARTLDRIGKVSLA